MVVPLLLVLSILAYGIGLVRAEPVYDLNGDGKVDIEDLKEVAKAFASQPGDPRWNPQLDFNGDNKIDITDYGILATHFSEGPTVLVAPEYWMGPITGLAGCFAAFGLFRIAKYRRR
jgi:hypothetical protein